MQRLKILLSVLAIIFIFTGCTGSSGTQTSSQKPVKTKENTSELTVITSFYPIYLHTINICKDISGVKVINMTTPQTGCLHDYTLTTENMLTLETAQIFVVNGLGMEQFMDKVIKQQPKLKLIDASQGIKVIEDEQKINPHVWVSITNAIAQVNNIGKQLAQLDPEHAALYEKNTQDYVKRLEAEKEKMNLSLKELKNRNIVTFHEAFPYFAKEFNLNIVAVVEREPGTEPSAKELEDTIEIVKASKVNALFAEPQYSAKSARAIAKETGARLYTLDPIVTGEANGDYDAYIKTMENNIKVIIEALK